MNPVRYADDPGRVEVGDLHIFAGENFMVTLSRGPRPDFGGVDQDLEDFPRLSSQGRGILLALLYQVADGYEPVVDRLRQELGDLETGVFERDEGSTERMYAVSREIDGFARAIEHLLYVLDHLTEEQEASLGR